MFLLQTRKSICHLLAMALVLGLTCLCACAFAESEVSDENLFNRADPYFMEGYNFVQSTDQIVPEEDSFITGFIEVKAGTSVRVNLNSIRNSRFVKYAMYDPNKAWKDTVKINDVSELTVRIFEDGFLRISVAGLDYEESITIYMGADRQDELEAMSKDSYLMSSTNTNIVMRTIDEDKSEYFIDRIDRNDPDYVEGVNFDKTTGEIVDQPDSFITGYIPIKVGDAIQLSLNSEKITPFIKYAIYDQDKNWVETAKIFQISDYLMTASVNGYIRFSVYGRIFRNSVTVYIHPATQLIADKLIEEELMPETRNARAQLELINSTLMTGDAINLFRPDRDEGFLYHQGFSQLTSQIVDDENSFMTGYIPVAQGQVVVVQITEESAFAKYALFDKDKQWLGTTRVANPTVLVVPIEEAGYFRFHGYGNAINGTTITIPTFKKLDINAVSGDIAARLDHLEEVAHVSNEVDVVMFMGQSNMAGRGIVSEEHPVDAPVVLEGAGWEFRAITDPTKLYEITKSMGFNENDENGINDQDAKTGGLVPSFVNAYYTHNGKVPVIAVSASEGGTSLDKWANGTPRLEDAKNRLVKCLQYLRKNNYTVRHTYMVWCQGESDDALTEQAYMDGFNSMFSGMKEVGVEKCFVVRIGSAKPATEGRRNIISYQNKLCKENADVILVSTDLYAMADKGLMRDEQHYYQEAYNICGDHAGVNTAYYVTVGKEPSMYDPFTENMYFSNVN